MGIEILLGLHKALVCIIDYVVLVWIRDTSSTLKNESGVVEKSIEAIKC